MKIVVIEDDDIVADTTERLLRIIDPKIEISGRLRSIDSAIKWFDENAAPDLIFADIELEDGNSFELFQKINSSSMIVFVTSHDYAIKWRFRIA